MVCTRLGGPEVLKPQEIEVHPPKLGEIKIRTRAAGLNFPDSLQIAGTYQHKATPPFVPGMEVAGDIIEVGPDVVALKPGDRVFATTGTGGYAEQVVTRAEWATRMPPTMDYVQGAGFPVTYGTSHLALKYRAGLKAGETLLVLGAGGGVGVTAIEIGKLLGARVIAAARGAEKLAIAKAHGADELIDYAAEDMRERVKALTGGHGADVVYDPVGGDAFDASLRCIAWEGRILIIGFASGRIPQAPTNIVLVKNITLLGFAWSTYRTHKPAVFADSYCELLAWFSAGKLKSHVSFTFPLADAVTALKTLLDRKSTGKIVLTMDAT
ncbi:MAG: NADPH:quinone oxidoreductase family protein [Alphaproteobacteria bacterium]|nr:NADPH:quinone oxidoreductase family protein [Alphaproteobacteria bacterium]